MNRSGSAPAQTVIIGGGAAGLICAGFAAQAGLAVTVADKNARPARKVLLTGKGRCNVTNDCPPEEFIRQVRTNPRFLYSAAQAFSPADAMRLFEGLGVPLKVERGRRVFPESDKAADIADAMVRFAKQNGARLLPKQRAAGIVTEEGAVTGVLLESGQTLRAQNVVIATGGRSYPLTGSDGDGYRLAQAVGHHIVQQRPSLVPVVTKEEWCGEIQGLGLKNVSLTLWEEGKKKPLTLGPGEMLFTHFGVSGPMVLSLSAYMRGKPSDYRLQINLKPALTPEQLDARILRDFERYKNREFANALGDLLPRTLIPIVVRLSGIPGETRVNAVTREQRRGLGGLIQALPLTPKALRPIEEAVITSGGVDVSEINPKTMESKLVKGLYFAGEVIDVDAFTGGYNLQIAYSTAFAAAKGISCP